MTDSSEDRLTVLIVDDVADIRSGYGSILEHAGYRVLTAESAEQALRLVAENRIHLALIDLFMPGSMDGIGLIDAIVDMRPPKPAIIAMSGAPHRAYRSSLQSAKYMGADQTLQKPIEPGVLVTAVRTLIGGGPALLNHSG